MVFIVHKGNKEVNFIKKNRLSIANDVDYKSEIFVRIQNNRQVKTFVDVPLKLKVVGLHVPKNIPWPVEINIKLPNYKSWNSNCLTKLKHVQRCNKHNPVPDETSKYFVKQ